MEAALHSTPSMPDQPGMVVSQVQTTLRGIRHRAATHHCREGDFPLGRKPIADSDRDAEGTCVRRGGVLRAESVRGVSTAYEVFGSGGANAGLAAARGPGLLSGASLRVCPDGRRT